MVFSTETKTLASIVSRLSVLRCLSAFPHKQQQNKQKKEERKKKTRLLCVAHLSLPPSLSLPWTDPPCQLSMKARSTWTGALVLSHRCFHTKRKATDGIIPANSLATKQTPCLHSEVQRCSQFTVVGRHRESTSQTDLQPPSRVPCFS